MIRTMVAAAVAIGVFAWLAIGPFPIMRVAPSVPVVQVSEIAKIAPYQSYLDQKAAGAWDATKPVPEQPRGDQPTLYLGLHPKNMAISAIGALIQATLIALVLTHAGTWWRNRPSSNAPRMSVREQLERDRSDVPRYAAH